jgi:hypothetical protein
LNKELLMNIISTAKSSFSPRLFFGLITGRFSRRLAMLLLSLTGLMLMSLSLALAAIIWDDVTPIGDWNGAYFVQKVGDNAYFAFQDSSTGTYALVEVTPAGAVADVIPSGSWNAVSTNATVVNSKGYFGFREAVSNTYRIYELDNGTWTDITPAGTWTILNGAAAVGTKGYFALRDDLGNYYLYELDNGVWDDVTPTGNWGTAYFVQKVGDNAYFAFQDNSTGAYALVEVTTAGAVADVIPTGSWNAISTRVTVVNGKGYFGFRESVSNTLRIYEVDNGTWTNITPTGTWTILNGAAAVGSKGAFALQDDSSAYHLYELNGGVWDEVTPTGTWSIGYFVQKVGNNAYFAFQNSVTNNYALVEVAPGSAGDDIIPTGSWNAISPNATIVNGKGYFGFRESVSNTFHIYELDNSAWTDVTPTGTWTILNGATNVDFKGYFALLDNANSYHLLQLTTCSSDITVTNANDSGSGSLRQAITDICEGGTIDFDNDYSIYLGSTLTLNRHLTIDGSGHSITLSGDSGHDGDRDVRVLNIGSNKVVTLSYLSVVSGTATDGSGITNNGILTLNYIQVADNKAVEGAGINNNHTLTLTGSTINNNIANANGGGIYNGGVLTLSGSTVNNNMTIGSFGAGIYNSGVATIMDSTLNGNSAGDSGGGIRNTGTLIMTNSTLSGNSAVDEGGGILNTSSGVLTATNSTLSGNSANSGGGIRNGSSNTMSLKNTLIANSGSGEDCFNVGTIATNTNNLIEDNTCSPTLSGDPLLATLGNYGGDTQTLALLPGSPAINAGDSATCSGAEVNSLDQRGVARPVACDIGAFESQGFTLTISGGNNQSTKINAAFASLLQVKFTANNNSEPVGTGGLIRFTASGSGASLSSASFTAATNGSGVASATVTANSVAGSYVVTATASGVSSPTTFNLTNTPQTGTTIYLPLVRK